MVRIKVVDEQICEIKLNPVVFKSIGISCSEVKTDTTAKLVTKDVAPNVCNISNLESFVSSHNYSKDAHGELFLELKTKNFKQDVEIAKKANASDLAKVAKTGSYNDLKDTPSNYDVGNAKITIMQGDEEKGSFSVNQKEDVTILVKDYERELNNKTDIDLSNCTRPYITEAYVNGTSWYNIYSNGWCEQGGLCVINSSWTNNTFLKPFKDLNYSVFIQMMHAANSVYHSYPACYAKVSTTTFQSGVYQGQASWYGNWYACGYIA